MCGLGVVAGVTLVGVSHLGWALFGCAAACFLAWLVYPTSRVDPVLEDEIRRLEVALGTIDEAVFSTDEEHRLVYANGAAQALIGSPLEKLVGLHVVELFPDSAEWREAVAEDRIERPRDHRRLQVQGSNGEEIVLHWTGGPLMDSFGRPRGAVFVLVNVTGTERHDEELRRLDKLESLGTLAGGIAHDFNNLLTGLLGNVSLTIGELSREGSEASKEEEDGPVSWLRDALTACEQARGLTEQLLTFARGGEPVKRLVDSQDLLRKSITFALRGSAVSVDFRLPSDLNAFDADPSQLIQVFQNIALNAKEAMPRGGAATIEARNLSVASGSPDSDWTDLPVGEYVEVRVSDEGGGIAGEIRKKIFDPYFTTKPKGTGLGLSSAHSIVIRHGGMIRVESSRSGATIVVVLPASLSRAIPIEEKEWSESEELHQHVLLMDDEEIVATTAKRMLESLGCRVDLVSEGERAIETFRKALDAGDPYSAVVLDLTVPGGMGGQEAAQSLRELDPEVHLVVTSGYCEAPVMANYEKYGFDRAVAKPFHVADLAASLVVASKGVEPAVVPSPVDSSTARSERTSGHSSGGSSGVPPVSSSRPRTIDSPPEPRT